VHWFHHLFLCQSLLVSHELSQGIVLTVKHNHSTWQQELTWEQDSNLEAGHRNQDPTENKLCTCQPYKNFTNSFNCQQVFMVMNIDVVVFWVMTLCGDVVCPFRGPCCLNLQVAVHPEG
jgi:hypothetical protein